MRKSGAHDLVEGDREAHGRASPGGSAGGRYRATSQRVLTKRPTKKMHRKK
jgi:hypothetical protein